MLPHSKNCCVKHGCDNNDSRCPVVSKEIKSKKDCLHCRNYVELVKNQVRRQLKEDDCLTIWDALYGRRSQLLAAGINDQLARAKKDQLERLMDLFHVDYLINGKPRNKGCQLKSNKWPSG